MFYYYVLLYFGGQMAYWHDTSHQRRVVMRVRVRVLMTAKEWEFFLAASL